MIYGQNGSINTNSKMAKPSHIEIKPCGTKHGFVGCPSNYTWRGKQNLRSPELFCK